MKIEKCDITGKYLSINERGQWIIISEPKIAIEFAEYMINGWEFYDDTEKGKLYQNLTSGFILTINEIFENFTNTK